MADLPNKQGKAKAVLAWTTAFSPWGEIGLAATQEGLVRVAFPEEIPAFLLWVQKRGAFEEETPLLRQAREELTQYFSGQRRVFTLPLVPQGTPFQRMVWQVTATIPWGEVRTYSWLASQIGRPAAVRAVGQALKRNPLPIVIPCHRVIGKGWMGGFAAGLPVKLRLLTLEGAWGG